MSADKQQDPFPVGGPHPRLTDTPQVQEPVAPSSVELPSERRSRRDEPTEPLRRRRTRKNTKQQWKKPRLDRVLPARFKTPIGPLPQKGLRGFFWKLIGAWLYSRFGWERLTKLSARERERNADEFLRDNSEQMTVAFANTKGGSAKTALATMLCALFAAQTTRRHMVAFDVNEGPGGTAGRLGVKPEETAQIREYLKRCSSGEFNDHARFLAAVGYHAETGVSVIASDPESNENFSIMRFMFGLHVAKQNSHSVFCDLGNTVKGKASLGSVRMANVLVFTGNVNMADSLKDLQNTRALYSDLGFSRKVKNCLIVIVGAKPRKRKEFAARYGVPVDRVFIVPYNRAMKLGKVVRLHRKILGAQIWRVPRHVRVVLKEILVAAIMTERVPEETWVLSGVHRDGKGDLKAEFITEDQLAA